MVLTKSELLEWLHDWIELSYAARHMINEDVTPNQIARANLLAGLRALQGQRRP